jgi:pyrimidine-specific ribonucleoside hydrolase
VEAITMLDVVWDMETQDPDDYLTLLLLLGHPDVHLKAVTITPGSPDQVGLVQQTLAWFGRQLPVGAHNLAHPKSCVSPWHHNVYGRVLPSNDAEPAAEVLLRLCDTRTTLITGGPLKNLGDALRLNTVRAGAAFRLGRLVAQGGFAGEGVVPREMQLDKFKGMATCPTYNLNGDPASALEILRFPGIGVRRFVSKNVCHAVYYDREMHLRFEAVKGKSLALELIWKGMDAYLRKQPAGKKLHDPLAACCAIDESIASWAEVELYRERGSWGARLSPGSRTWIITNHDHDKFVRTLTAYLDNEKDANRLRRSPPVAARGGESYHV